MITVDAYSIQCNRQWSARLKSLRFVSVVDHGLMIFIGTVGEVHADDIQASYRNW